MTSYLPQKNIFVVFPFVVFYFFGFLCAITSFYLHIQVLLTYILFACPILLKDLRANLPTYRTHHSLRSCPNLVHEYRCFEILHVIGMGFYGPLILPFHAFLSVLVVLGAYLITRHWMDMDYIAIYMMFNWVFIFFAVWALVLQFSGFYFLQCTKTLKSWKHFKWNKKDLKDLKRFTKSCKPLKIGDQIRFNFNNLSVLFFIRGISRGIVRALLALK